MAWCTTAQIQLLMNTNEVTDYADDNADGTADTGVITACAEASAAMIWSHIHARYSATTAMDPDVYTEGDGTYPVLEHQNALLAVSMLQARQGMTQVPLDHPVLKWAILVGLGIADADG